MPVRGGDKVAQRRACLPSGSAPEVPFGAATRVATAVVLARYSALNRVFDRRLKCGLRHL
jgi:hypothetical protein